MALIIKNETFTLSDSGVNITGVTIQALIGRWIVKSPDNVLIDPQVNVFSTPEKGFENTSNYLKLVNFPINWKMNYQYGVDDVNFMYWLDLEIKAKILEAYPDIDESNITITTKPIVE